MHSWVGCGAVPDTSSRAAPQYGPSGWAVAVSDRVDCDAYSWLFLAVFWRIWFGATSGYVSFPMDAGRIQHSRLFLLCPLPASSTSCFLLRLISASSSSCFSLRSLSVPFTSFFVRFLRPLVPGSASFFVRFLLHLRSSCICQYQLSVLGSKRTISRMPPVSAPA